MKPKLPLKKNLYAYMLFDDGCKFPHDVVGSWIEAKNRQRGMPNILVQKVRLTPVGRPEK